MLGPNDLPFAVSGHRTLIVEKSADERTRGGLYVPDTCKERYFSGRLVAAGLTALDQLYDQGYQLGDDVEFGRYAGLREAWDHVVEGDHTLPEDAYQWQFDRDVSTDACKVYTCAKTGAVRKVESVIVLNVADLIASVQLARRLSSGEMRYVHGITREGRTQHVLRRRDEADESVFPLVAARNDNEEKAANGYAA